MSDLTGELIDGRYQLLRQVANGGMASIYEAIDTRLDLADLGSRSSS